jgi:outer membrane protein OmpA-like peptidoglycan-associated protein
MAKEGKTVAIIRFRPKDGDAGQYDVEVEIDGSASYEESCVLPPTYEGIPLRSLDPAKAEEGVVWRKAGAEPPEDAFLVSDIAMLEQAGAALFDAVFSQRLTGVLETLAQNGVALRFDLTKAPALMQEPFEALFLRRGEVFLGTQAMTPITRLLRPDGIGPRRRDVQAPARALFAASNPGGALDQSGEIENLKNSLAKVSAEQPAMAWTFRVDLTRKSFEQALAEVDPDIVHFLGHGIIDPATGERSVLFFDEVSPNVSQPVSARDFRAMLQNSNASLVMLNSCASAETSSSDVFAGVGQGLIRDHTPFVVAMRAQISDKAALIFSERFYTELAKFKTPEEAVTLARSAIRTVPEDVRRRVEFATPVLYATGAREALFAQAPPPARGIFKWVFMGLGGLAIIGLVFVLGSGGGFQTANNVSNAAPASDGNAMAMDDMGSAMNAATSAHPQMSAPPSALPEMADGAFPQMADMMGPEIGNAERPARQLRRSRRTGLPTVLPDRWNYSDAVGNAPVPPPPPPPCPAGWSQDANGICIAASPPSPPPPPPPVQSYAGPFIVFFDWDKDAISPAAASILDTAAAAYAQRGGGVITLAGHADRSGSDTYNVGLSQRRANIVRAYLATHGVPDASIRTEADGESRPLVDTADGVREPQNRRVEITFGPPEPANP